MVRYLDWIGKRNPYERKDQLIRELSPDLENKRIIIKKIKFDRKRK